MVSEARTRRTFFVHALLWLAHRRPLGALALAGLAIHIAAFAKVSTPEMFWSAYCAWVIAPAVATLILGVLIPREVHSLWFCLLAAAPLLFGVAVYLSVLLGKTDAQEGLIFLFTPLWQLIALPFAWLIAAVVGLALDSDA